MPIGIILAVHFDMGTVGMWIGMGCASFLQVTSYFIFILRLNWEKEAIKVYIVEPEGNMCIISSGSIALSKQEHDKPCGNHSLLSIIDTCTLNSTVTVIVAIYQHDNMCMSFLIHAGGMCTCRYRYMYMHLDDKYPCCSTKSSILNSNFLRSVLGGN